MRPPSYNGCVTTRATSESPDEFGGADRAPTDARVGAEVLIELSTEQLSLDALVDWATVPECGAVVSFSGVVRDHADGRDDVVGLTYEAYEAPAREALARVAAAARSRWPKVSRVALGHRLGQLDLSETSVIVVVSAGHRAEAFDAARYCIDTIKETVPIWKQEHWAGGSGWGLGSRPIQVLSEPAEPGS